MNIKKVTTIPYFPLPVRASAGAAAYDLHAAIDEPVTLLPGRQAMIPTGYAWEIPAGKVGLLLPRSGLGVQGVVLGNLVGVIDCDFRAEIMACIWNRSAAEWNDWSEAITIKRGQRLCQLLIVDAYTDTLELVEELTETERGAGGFGSTGTN